MLDDRRRDARLRAIEWPPGKGDRVQLVDAPRWQDGDRRGPRHSHVLRHTFATRYYRRSPDLARPRGPGAAAGPLGPKTTMIYVDDPAERERLMLRASEEATTLELDRLAA